MNTAREGRSQRNVRIYIFYLIISLYMRSRSRTITFTKEMSSPLLRHVLTLANQKLLQSFQLPCTHGRMVRSLSSNLYRPTSVIGSNGSQSGLSPNRMSALSALSETGFGANENHTTGRNGSWPISQAVGQSRLGVSLEQALTSLTLSPLESHISADIVSPGLKMSCMAQTILDPSPSASLMQECPAAIPLAPFCDPDSNPREIHIPTVGGQMKKYASNILHKRRRKMNHHKYLKWKRRNKFKIRIHRQRSRKKKRLKWEKHLDKYRFKGLRPGQGEQILAKKRAKLAIFLRYIGIKTDEELEAEKEKEKDMKPISKVGKIVPEPLLPKGAKIG